MYDVDGKCGKNIGQPSQIRPDTVLSVCYGKGVGRTFSRGWLSRSLGEGSPPIFEFAEGLNPDVLSLQSGADRNIGNGG